MRCAGSSPAEAGFRWIYKKANPYPGILSGRAAPSSEDEALDVFRSMGTSTNEMVWESIRVKNIRQGFYPDHPEIDPLEGFESPWFYEEVGNTAIITFDEFAAHKKIITQRPI